MKRITCEACGANDFTEENGYRICSFCGTRYCVGNHSSVALDEDISRLLKKCQEEPKKARQYANLILDIDPTNTEALKYLL